MAAPHVVCLDHAKWLVNGGVEHLIQKTRIIVKYMLMSYRITQYHDISVMSYHVVIEHNK